jgi:hypothetical protein
LRRIACILCALALSGAARADGQLLLDQGRDVRGLHLFPVAGRPLEFRYLPNRARLATSPDGGPAFSFIRYVVNEAGKDTGKGVTQAGGGGVLHLLALYDTDEAQVKAAYGALRKELQDGGSDEEQLKQLRLEPIVFDAGRYTLVSSVLRQNQAKPVVGAGSPQEGAPAAADDDRVRRVLATGRAPVLEGQRIALSFELDPQQTTLLLESFRMANPDISISFDMSFDGVTDAYDAEVVVDWDQFHTSGAFEAGGSAYFVSADIALGFDELRRNNTIRIVSRGSSKSMEALVESVYAKLLDMLFRPIAPEQVPEDKRGDLMDALGTMFGPKGVLSSRNLFGIGAHMAFELKHYKTSGRSVLRFDQQDSVARHAFIAANVGDLWTDHGEDPRYFRTVNLADPAFQQREVHVAVDGALLAELGKSINSAVITLRKHHGDGTDTVKELVVDRKVVEEHAGDLRLVYGWAQDADRVEWLAYEVRTEWRFEGGQGFTSDWHRAQSAMIDLEPPYQRQVVELMGNPDVLAQQGVRAVVARVEYPFFGQTRRQQFVVRPASGEHEGRFEITLPRDAKGYDYTLTWMLAGGKQRVQSGRDENFFLLLDELPPEPAATPGAPATAPTTAPAAQPGPPAGNTRIERHRGAIAAAQSLRRSTV